MPQPSQRDSRQKNPFKGRRIVVVVVPPELDFVRPMQVFSAVNRLAGYAERSQSKFLTDGRQTGRAR